MRQLILLVLLFVVARPPLVAGAPTHLVAPVQVEVLSGDRQYSYDCYPSAQPAAEQRMTVYLNTPNGLAMYSCDLVGRVLIIPSVPSAGFNLAEYLGDASELNRWNKDS